MDENTTPTENVEIPVEAQVVPTVEETPSIPPIPEDKYKHYIRVRKDNCITEGWSNGPMYSRTPTEDDILYNDKAPYQFCLIIGGERSEPNPPLIDFMTRVPLYKWDGENTSRRTDEEMKPEQEAYKAEQKRQQRLYELHRMLLDTDYIDNKIVEVLMEKGMDAAHAMAESYADKLADRQSWRKEIDALEP